MKKLLLLAAMLLPLMLAAQTPTPVKPKTPAVFDGDLKKWVDERITYPAEAMDIGVTGSIYVKYVIDTTGKISWIGSRRDPCNTLLYLELKRVLSESPRWTPALDDKGKPMESDSTFSYDFTKKLDPATLATMTVGKSTSVPRFLQDKQQKRPEEFFTWIYENYDVPKELKKKDYEYDVTMSFTVGKDAKVKDIQVQGCDNAALEQNLRDLIVKSKWKAATTDGKERDYLIVSRQMKFSGDKNGKIEDISSIEQRQPQYPGGMEEFFKYVMSNVSGITVETNAESKVIVRFTIDRDGSLTDITVKEGNNFILSQRVVDALKRCPAWEPGILFGKPARVSYTLPVVVKPTTTTTSTTITSPFSTPARPSVF